MATRDHAARHVEYSTSSACTANTEIGIHHSVPSTCGFCLTGLFLIYTVSQKTAPLRQVGINSVIFEIQKKIRNTRFVGNLILNKSCEFYYDDVTMASFIGNK